MGEDDLEQLAAMPRGNKASRALWPCVPDRFKGFRKEGQKYHLGPNMWAKSTLIMDEVQAGEPQIRAAGSVSGTQGP